ncbi:MAG TPA: hypothetical protein VHY34_02535 [Caulobacteraceae bacterium]|nr:hypothetical protein [Caulobacteraceae bacterium]
MADSFTHFSCYLDLDHGVAKRIDAALALFKHMADALEADEAIAIGFTCQAAPGKPAVLRLCDTNGHVSPNTSSLSPCGARRPSSSPAPGSFAGR